MEAGVVRLGREVTQDRNAAEAREWLVPNGIGGYASGTVAGTLTRRYHGLLVAATSPPSGRHLIVPKLEAVLTYCGVRYELGTNAWADGSVAPHGYTLLESFALDGNIATWTYALGDAVFSVTLTMQSGANVTAVVYALERADEPATLDVRVLADDRDHHGTSRQDERVFANQLVPGGVRVALPSLGASLVVRADAEWSMSTDWYRAFELERERERGLEAVEDHPMVGSFRATIVPQGHLGVTLAFGDGEAPRASAIVEERRVLDERCARGVDDPQLRMLAIAADAFVVDRRFADRSVGKTVIAGYHWFADWGRDTMIALPGLTLARGHHDVARTILRTFARYVDGGMIPNRFPDGDEPPEYNTFDASLWYIEAVRAYVAATNDRDLAVELYPTLSEIVDAYKNGTRYGIVMDASDGLVRGGEPGVQLTWMDAKVGDWVVTPRIGKPIEINALWYAALRTLEHLSQLIDRSSAPFRALAEKTRAGFARYWNGGYTYDVLDGPGGNDATLRPNAIFAVSLHASPLTQQQQHAIVDVCGREFVTPRGLRSLSPRDPAYVPQYLGDVHARDGAYHQGTVWGWLIGPFASAHYHVHGDRELARSFVLPLLDELSNYGLGSIGEIFDAEPPFAARGTIAQAWSVAEVLRVLDELGD
jgi:predicted glycogen debranching enzyme